MRPRVSAVNRVLGGLSRLGVPVERHEIVHPGAVLPGVWIDRGALCVAPWAAHPGDVLHEAGHLAIVPARFRPVIAPGNLYDEEAPLTRAVTAWLRTEEAFDLIKGDPDAPIRRALAQMGEMEAIAWAYAAAKAIGFSTRQAFLFRYPGVEMKHQPFEGDGEEVWMCLELRQHAGIHGLQHAGMCDAKTYPQMNRWMQE